jgi:hypothetical protein
LSRFVVVSDGHKTPAFVNSPSHFADIGKFKVCPFDHPWGKLDDLLAGRISCAMSLRTTMPLTRSTSAACCMVIPRLRGVEAQNEQLQLGAFRVWEVGNSGNLGRWRQLQQGHADLQTTAPTILRWKQRFEEPGMAGLDPRHKGSQPRVATAVVQARIARKRQQKPSDGSRHWPCRKMAAALGLSKSRKRG